ncbi:Uncharacterised protein [Listeria grayi]|uniref:TrbL/VirB6 plasmid conjugal transfer protein n=1 Tax=Listeria grayi TaxID=1641 RepID=A0A378MCU4_LISGR|nr:UbiA family prenyltransferase [Listeria grayi]STY44199.1 Uncharacterised protein [Listeria grayi]
MKKWQWVLVILCSITFLLQGMTVQAKEKEALSENQTKPKVVKEGGVELHIKRFPLSRYQVNNEAADTKFKGSVVSLANVSSTVTQMTAVVVDTAMDELFNLKVIDKFAGNITSISTSLYHVLLANFGKILFVYAVGYVFYLALVKQRAGEAMKKGLLFLVVMVLGGWYMAHSGYVIKGLNALSTETQGKLMLVGNKIVDVANGQGSYADTDKVQKGKEQLGTVSILRNVYFDMAVEKPFLLTNFGETSKEKINKQKTDSGLSRTDTLLSYKLSEDGEKEKNNHIKEEIKDFRNENVESGNVLTQWGQASFGAIVSIAFGIPFLGLALVSFLLQYIAILIALVLPVMLLLSFIPQFANSFFVGFKSLVVVFLTKAVLAVMILVIYLISAMTDSLIPPNSFGMYVINMVVVAVIFIVMIWKRDKLVKFITAGKVQQVDGNLLQNVKKDMVEPAFSVSKNTAKVGAAVLTAPVKAGAAVVSKGRDMWNKYRSKGEGIEDETTPNGRTKQTKEEGKQTLRPEGNAPAPRERQISQPNFTNNETSNTNDPGEQRNTTPSGTPVLVQEKETYSEEARTEQTISNSNGRKVPMHVYSDPQEEIERSEQVPKESKVPQEKKAVPPQVSVQRPIERKPSSYLEPFESEVSEEERAQSKSTILQSYAKQKRDKQ